MPNWCSNAVIVKGPKKDLDTFKATLNSKEEGEVIEFSFKQTVPPPSNYFSGDLGAAEKQMCAEKGLVDWYSWNSANWGTKWDACEVRVEINPKNVKVWFDTAWAPPLAWLKNASAKFPNLTFEMAYNECGMAFYGVAIATKGEVEDNGGNGYESGDTDDEGNPKGDLKKHVNKYGLGMGG